MRFPKPAHIKLQFEKNKLTLKYKDAETRRWDDIGEESKARHVVSKLLSHVFGSSAAHCCSLLTHTLSHHLLLLSIDSCANP